MELSNVIIYDIDDIYSNKILSDVKENCYSCYFKT